MFRDGVELSGNYCIKTPKVHPLDRVPMVEIQLVLDLADLEPIPPME
jgi:hypothetical protein